jgi:glycosyltransferase involved in cell wall biosynthesis
MGNLAVSSNLPLVTVVTPVYNGDKYLAQCIESVLAQTYQNFEYVIVNNCSTDSTLDIAKAYADQDHRIKIYGNATFVNCEENHNIAFRLISAEAKYCKVVSADDWIYPECIRLLVEVAEKHPTAAIIGSYQLKDGEVKWKGVPRDLQIIEGRKVCRMSLLEDVAIFGPPTSSLYRCDLIRLKEQFFHPSLPHADICVCYEHLQHYDFGFVHEILSVERVHGDRETTKVGELYMDAVAAVEFILKYGPMYLDERELDMLSKQSFAIYYRRLGGSVLKMKGREFWRYHISRMRELGNPISWRKVVWATLNEIVDEMKSPKVGYQKLVQVIKGKHFEF